MKSPFDTICEIFLEGIQRQREHAKFVFEHLDKFMIWIVGFSISGITLITANVSQFNQTYKDDIRTILLLLIISIITGILYRVAFFRHMTEYKKIETFLEVSFSNKKFMEGSTDLADEMDIQVVVKRLKDDFDEDVSNAYGLYESLDETNKELLLKSFKEQYLKLSEWAEKSFEGGLIYAKDTYKNAFGLSDKEIEKLFNGSDSTFYWKFYWWVATISWLISCGLFITVLIILCVKY